MNAKQMRFLNASMAVGMALVVSGCGQFVRDQGRSPSQLVILNLEAASGAQPDEFGNTLGSDVLTFVNQTINGQQVRVPTVFGDLGRVTMQFILKNQGPPGVTAAPTPISQITITRYRVAYTRADGRNTPGTDVPYPFDGALTFTVPPLGTASASFDLVRLIAKQEAPLVGLVNGNGLINTIADVTFYGRDQAGNDVTATAAISIQFGNFGDPE